MNTKDKIIELLEKKSLTEKDKQELESLVSGDSELEKLVSTYRQLSEVVSHSSHLGEEEISEYILYKNDINTGNNSIISRAPFIEAHLRKCTYCSEILKDLNEEYSDVDSFLSDTISEGKPASSEATVPISKALTQKYRAPRYAFASVLVIGLVYLSLYLISSFTTPMYYNDASLKGVSDFSVNRGRATEDFQNSLKALEKHDYNDAIEFLQKDIQQNSNDETIFYSYYIIGLSYLESAGHSVLGLFPHYNKERAAKGSEYLKESISKNNSGKFTNIRLNAYFYLAKASLMLNDKKSAQEYLSKVIAEKGSKMDDAKKLLGELE